MASGPPKKYREYLQPDVPYRLSHSGAQSRFKHLKKVPQPKIFDKPTPTAGYFYILAVLPKHSDLILRLIYGNVKKEYSFFNLLFFTYNGMNTRESLHPVPDQDRDFPFHEEIEIGTNIRYYLLLQNEDLFNSNT